MNHDLILVTIGFLIFAILLLFIYYNKKNQRNPNYLALFIIGLSWFPIGIATKNTPLAVLGVILFSIGVANKDQWKKREKWSDLPTSLKVFKIVMLTILTATLVAGITYHFLN